MHTLNRILTALMLLVVLVPPATFALVSIDDKEEAREELQNAIGTAVTRYQQRSGLQNLKVKGERVLEEQGTKLQSLEKRKLELRKAVAKQQRILRSINALYGTNIETKQGVQSMIAAEKRKLSRLFRHQYLRQEVRASANPRDLVMGIVFHTAATELSEAIVEKTQMKFLRDLVAAEKALWKLEALGVQRADVLAEYHGAQKAYDNAEELIERSDAQLEEIKRITEEVHTQVLKLQGELARIDARLKAKAERALLEKGLIGPDDIGKSDSIGFKPQFSWPVYGRVSAGFHNESYKKHFGVPHYGTDIVVAQGTVVTAAADGVVFLVRDGGKTGYSYILIGHRGGYATLYGHVQEAYVTAGQDVTAGQAIASSGGKPGTHGAGPMTTGAHLHFEVIRAGVNIDPKSVLP